MAPAAIEDSRCALRWVYKNAKLYNFDLTKIVTTGNSAGGHLALVTGMFPASAGFDNTCAGDRSGGSNAIGPNNTEELKVAAIVDWFGIADMSELLSGPNMKSYAVAWLGAMPNRESSPGKSHRLHTCVTEFRRPSACTEMRIQRSLTARSSVSTRRSTESARLTSSSPCQAAGTVALPTLSN